MQKLLIDVTLFLNKKPKHSKIWKLSLFSLYVVFNTAFCIKYDIPFIIGFYQFLMPFIFGLWAYNGFEELGEKS